MIARKLEECIKLNAEYKEAYYEIKKKKIGQEKKEFSFSEQYIFGRFDYFVTRMENILNMFQKIKLFTELFDNRLESLLAWDLIDDDAKYFEGAVKFLRTKDYDFLCFRNTQFDKDYLDFMNRIETLTERLRVELEKCYDDIWDTPHSFQYLARFEKLSKVFPIGGLVNKYTRVITCFRAEMDRVNKFFKKQQGQTGTLPRNYPETAGKIYWIRSLLYHLKYFIDHFHANEGFKKIKDYRKLVKQYNETGVQMMKYELHVQESFKNFKIYQVEAMIAKPVMKNLPAGGPLTVNFDPILANYLKENEKLCKLDIALPSVNRFLIKRKTWFYDFRDMVSLVLKKYYDSIESVIPDLKRLFTPHLIKIKSCLDPGLVDLDWTCHQWDEFTEKCLKDIDAFASLVSRANDIFTSRVERTLESMTEIELYELPSDKPWTLDRFLDRVKERCIFGATELQRKSLMVEEAIEDLITLASEVDAKKTDGKDTDFLTVAERQKLDNSFNAAAKELRRNYSNIVSTKLISLIRSSLRVLAKHFNTPTESYSLTSLKYDFEENFDCGEIIFVLVTQLNIPAVEVVPSMEEVQGILVSAGKNTTFSINVEVCIYKKIL